MMDKMENNNNNNNNNKCLKVECFESQISCPRGLRLAKELDVHINSSYK